MVGRLSPWKGQDVFLRHSQRHLRKASKRRCWSGSAMFGEESTSKVLLDLVAAARNRRPCRVPWVRRRRAQLLTEVDALVHASVIPEPFGQVVVEGMAAGLAVVASNEGGPAEIDNERVDGLLVPTGDVNALAEITETFVRGQ